MVRLHTDFGQSLLYCSGLSHDLSQTQKQHFCQITDINKNILANVTVDPRKFLQSFLSCPFQVLGFLLASFGFVEFFYILLERSQEIQQHMVFLLSPIIRSMTVVNTVALS